MKIARCLVAALALSTAPLRAQTAQTAQPPASAYYSQADLAARSQQLIARAQKNAKGSGNSTLTTYPNCDLQFNVKTKSGISEMHAHNSDLIVITDGEATIVTGGSIPDSTVESPAKPAASPSSVATSRRWAKATSSTSQPIPPTRSSSSQERPSPSSTPKSLNPRPARTQLSTPKGFQQVRRIVIVVAMALSC